MKVIDNLSILKNFVKARWIDVYRTRAEIEIHQAKKLDCYLRTVLPKAPYYRNKNYAVLKDLPIIDKQDILSNFQKMNTAGIHLNEAQDHAEKAEQSRDFSPSLKDISVGLSSGTTGRRGVFIVSKKERLKWAGVIMARILTTNHILKILNPLDRRLEIAFFLRADNNLYQTLSGWRLNLDYYDITRDTRSFVERLNRQRPDILVAPASILASIARMKLDGSISIIPKKIISVAEVLEGDDSDLIQRTFGRKPEQIYQATEGFLGYTCKCGNIHLNETYIHIEKEWLDNQRKRFYPVITDFSRTTQIVARYRMNDILHCSGMSCDCGSCETVIDRIEGRADDVFFLSSPEDEKISIYPDSLRHAMMMAGEGLEDYRIEQHPDNIVVRLYPDDDAIRQKVSENLRKLWLGSAATEPKLVFQPWEVIKTSEKRRRISNLTKSAA